TQGIIASTFFAWLVKRVSVGITLYHAKEQISVDISERPIVIIARYSKGRRRCRPAPASSINLLDRPQVDGIVAAYAYGFFGLPVVHVEIVRYNAASGFQFFLKLGSKLQVYRRKQVHGHHIGFAEIELEQVAQYKFHLVGHTGGLGIGFGFSNSRSEER